MLLVEQFKNKSHNCLHIVFSETKHRAINEVKQNKNGVF